MHLAFSVDVAAKFKSSESEKSKYSTGEIILIVLGSIAGCIIIVVLGCLLHCHRRYVPSDHMFSRYICFRVTFNCHKLVSHNVASEWCLFFI